MATFYDALNAANQNALSKLSSLKAENDWNPVPSFLNTINARLRLQQAINAGRERQDYYNELRSKINTGGNGNGGNHPPAGIGADAQNGVYGVGDTNSVVNAQSPTSVSVGSYAGDVAPQSNKFTFNESDYVPSAQNGYHLGDYPQTEMYGDPTDYQRQMAANAIGYNLGSLEPRQQTWFSKTPQNTSQDSFGKAFQAAENQMGGTTPTINKSSNFINGDQAKQFGSLIQTARNNGGQFNQQDWNTLKSFQNPVSDVAPTVGGINTGATGNQAFDEKMNLRRWLEWDAQQNGVTNPLVSLDRYNMFMQPMRQQAELDELRNAYYTLHDPKASDIAKRNAATLISYTKGNPFMMEDHELLTDKTMYDMGMSRNSNYDVGNNILSVLGDYEEGEQWMSPDGTGTSRTQCSNWVSDVLRKAGIKGLGSANGDELIKQFGKAYHNGLDGIQPGDVLNFKDHVGIYAGNGQYVARNSSGGVHQGSMEEAIKYFGQPLGYGSIREFSGANAKYIRDPNNPNNFKGRAAEDYKHHLRMKEIQAKTEGNIKTALIKNQIKGSGSNRSSSNSKNTFDLHESLNSLSDIEGKYDANADDATQKNYKKEYDKAYGNVKSSIQNEYPNLKQSVEQLKSKGYTTKQIGVMLAEDIYNNNNTKIGFEPLADIVSEIITSSNYGDPSYNSKELSSEIKQELGKTLERTKTLRNRSKRRPNSYDSIFGGYFDTSNAGLTDRDILDRQGSEKKDATRRILSEAERVGNIKYDDDKKFKEANKTEIERLYDEVEAHKKGKKK